MAYPEYLLESDLASRAPIDYDLVAAVDPLEVRDDLQEIPDINRRLDSHLAVALLNRTVERAQVLQPERPEDAVAALGQMEFPVASLLRHGVNPLKRNATLGDTLIKLGQYVGQQPRGSGVTYSLGNSRNTDPSHRRELGIEQTFTGTPGEQAFIESLRLSNEAMMPAEQAMAEIRMPRRDGRHTEVTDDATFAATLRQVAGAIDIMKAATVEVREKFTITWFNANIKPWFELLNFGTEQDPIIVHAGSGAHFSLTAMDKMLWGGDLHKLDPRAFSDFPEYAEYLAETVPYMDFYTRLGLKAFTAENDRCILPYIHANYEPDSPVYQAAAAVLASQRQFRFPHNIIAQRALSGREKGKQVGGGGFDSIVLEGVKTKTLEWSAMFGYKGRVEPRREPESTAA